MTTPRLARAVRKVLDGAPRPAQITTETVEAVRADGRYQVRGRALAPTGMARLRAGDPVSVAWGDGRPKHIVAHQWRKSAPPRRRVEIAGVIEELSMQQTTHHLIYRNDQQVTLLGGGELWPEIPGDTGQVPMHAVFGQKDATVLMTVERFTPLFATGTPYQHESTYDYKILKLTNRSAGLPAGDATVGLTLTAQETAPIFDTPFPNYPRAPGFRPGERWIFPFDFVQDVGPLFALTKQLQPLAIGQIPFSYEVQGSGSGSFDFFSAPVVVGRSGILLTPAPQQSEGDMAPLGIWFVDWDDKVATRQRVLIWGGIPTFLDGQNPEITRSVDGFLGVALWVERPGNVIERTLYSGSPQADANFQATVPPSVSFSTTYASDTIQPTSASPKYATWFTRAERGIRILEPVLNNGVLWSDTVVRHYLTDLSTGETAQIARYEQAAVTASGTGQGYGPGFNFSSGVTPDLEATASTLSRANLPAGWLLQAKNATLDGLLGGFSLTNPPTFVRPMKIRNAAGALSFDLTATTPAPDDQQFDRDLFLLKPLPTALAATVDTASQRVPRYHVVPDIAELGRTSQ